MRSPWSENDLLTLADHAARAAGAELLRRFGEPAIELRAKSTPTDPVSAADVAAETVIREILGRERPDDAILGEEGGSSPGTGTLRWIVDPLDGTVNYLYGNPQFAVSVACADSAGALAGVVLDPVRGELFAATRSGPATLDGDPLEVKRPNDLSHALVSTGFAYHSRVRAAQAEVLTRLLPKVRDIRRAGAAALDLAWCGSGRADAFYERGLKPWDSAAGGLICLRAGLAVRQLEPVPARGDLVGMPEGLIVAPPALIDELEALVLGSAAID